MTAATDARDEAIDRVNRAADEYWKQVALDSVKSICRDLGSGAEFTTDLVWEYVERNPFAHTHESRAMGAIIAHARKLKLIEKVNRWEQSERVACHARPLQVWRVR